MFKGLLKLFSRKDLHSSRAVSNDLGFDHDEVEFDRLAAHGLGDDDDLGDPDTGVWHIDESSEEIFGHKARPITGELRDSKIIRTHTKSRRKQHLNDDNFSDMLEIEAMS